jgi:hypothetical protein
MGVSRQQRKEVIQCHLPFRVKTLELWRFEPFATSFDSTPVLRRMVGCRLHQRASILHCFGYWLSTKWQQVYRKLRSKVHKTKFSWAALQFCKTATHSGRIQSIMNLDFQPMHFSPWMTRSEAAIYIARKPKTLANWAAEGKGPRFSNSTGRRPLYHIDDLDAWIRGVSTDVRLRGRPVATGGQHDRA